MERKIVLVIAALMATAYAGPVQRQSTGSCARTCTDSNKMMYEPGKTYQYRYVTETSTQVQGATNDHATINLNAIVDMGVVSKCEMDMRLSDISLTEYNPITDEMMDISGEFRQYLEKYPVKISFQDGTVQEVCVTTDEPTWVLNIKRGLLSLFQNSMDDFSTNQTVSETDVAGVCDTEYYVRDSGWYTRSVGKRKDLIGCTERTGYNTAIQSIPYTAQSDIQSVPVVNSDHDCEHEMDKVSGTLKTVTCHEQHKFRPFSNKDNGAITKTTQTLTFIRKTSGTKAPVRTDRRVSLKFDHVIDPNAGQKTKKDITLKLTEICERTKSGVQEGTPMLFSDLVFMMRSADVNLLADLYKMVTEGKICPDNKFRVRKFFLDALPMVGTSASLDLMTDLITREVVTGIEADSWITSLAFVKNPNQDMLRAVKPLINLKDNEDKTLLSVGTLVHSYCTHHGNCERDAVVRAIISAMKNKMAKGCKVTDANFKSTVMALRGIGNAGFAQSAVPILDVCMRVTANPIEVRLSAIDAFRRMPCDVERRGVMKIYMDKDEDSEIRIAAYRVLMECPTPAVLDTVKRTLASEEVNQVGSYVWTHLTNIMETSDRHKQDIRAILENETFKKEFDLDKRKFSRNYEGSLFLDKINTGAKAEGDLIWSTKSFMPRSAMVNLTVDLFGHSVNLLELGGRAEGIEYFMESLFGPNGYFADMTKPKSAETALKTVKQKKLEAIDGRFDTSRLDDLRASMYVRVFGNELRYMNVRGLDALMAGPGINVLDMLIQLAKDNDYTYSHSLMFLDTSLIIPTCAGFPLNLTVNGTATMDLRLKGKMDLRAPPSVEIKGLIQPSAAIDISSMMSVDAFVTRAGIKMVSTLHTSTAVQGKFHVTESGALTAEWEMPEPKMEIIGVKSSFFTVHRDIEREQKMIKTREQQIYCTADQLASITGLELCAELSYPNASGVTDAPHFPLTGPISAGIYLYNRDSHNVYQMTAKSLHTRDSNLIHFKFNTPNSRIDRHVSLDFDLNKKSHKVDMSLTSPWQKATAQASLTSEKNIKGFNGKMQISDLGAYSFEAKMVRDRVGNAWRYTPTMDVTAPSMKPINIHGMLMYNGVRQINMEYEMAGLTKDPVSASLTISNRPALQGIRGSITLQKDKAYSFDINLNQKADKKKITFKPMISIRVPDAEVLAFGGNVVYIYGKKVAVNLVLDKAVPKKMILKGFVAQMVKRRRTLYRTKMNFASKPMDFALDMKLNNKKFRTIATDIDFTYVIRKVARNNIKLVSKITNLSSSSLTKGKAAINFAVKRNPELSLKMLGNINHKKRHTDFDIDLRYGEDFKNENKHVTVDFALNRQIKSIMDVKTDIQSRIRFPAQGINVFVKGAHTHDDQNVDSSLQLRLGKTLPIETSLRINDMTNKFLKVSGEYRLSFPGRNIILNETFTQINYKKYLNSFNLQLRKGKKTAIMTSVTYPTDNQIDVVSDIHVYGCKPVQVTAGLDLEPTNFRTALSYKKDSDKYAASVTSRTRYAKNRQTSQITVDLLHPERHILWNMGLKNINDILEMETDLKWNAGRNETEKVKLSTWMEAPTSDKFNGSITISYPFRTLILNVHQLIGAKYSTHADFEWEMGKKIVADAVIGVKQDTIVGTAEISTPFVTLPKLRIDLSHKDNREEYLTSMDVKWDETVGFVFNLKKPANLKTLVASLGTSSSFKVLRRVKFEINHKLSSSLASSAKLTWNKRLVQATVTLQNTTKGKKEAYRGTVDLKTSFQYIKKGKLDIIHDNNGRNFNTIIKVMRNRQMYSMNNKITHRQTEKSFDNSGTTTFVLPNMNADLNWKHAFSANKHVQSTVNSAWGKKKKSNVLSFQMNADMVKQFVGSLQLQTPFKIARDISVEANLKQETDSMDTNFRLSRNGGLVGFGKMGYNSGNAPKQTRHKIATAGIALEIPSLDVNTKIESNATTEQDSAFANLNAVITKDVFLHINAFQKFDNPEDKAISSLRITLPKQRPIQYTYTVHLASLLTTITRLEYGEDKAIEMKTELKIRPDDKEYRGFASLTTPFASLPKMQGAINYFGDADSFQSDAFMEILPVLNKTSITVSWEGVRSDGFDCQVRLNMPLDEYPYIQTGVHMKMKDGCVTSGDVSIEYMPRQIMRAEFHTLFEKEIDVAAKLTAPFSTLSISHKGNMQTFKSSGEFELEPSQQYGIDLDFTNKQKIESTLTTTIPGRKPITAFVSINPSVQGFKSHIEVLHNKKNKFLYDIEFKNSSDVDLSTSGYLTSEYISDNEYSAAFSLQGQLVKFNTHAEFSRSRKDKSLVDITFDVTKDIEGGISVKSPMIKNVKAEFSHRMDRTSVQSKANFIRGGKKVVDIIATFNMDRNVNGEISIKSPISDNIKMSGRFDGQLENFNLQSEGSVGGNTAEIEMSSRFDSSFNQHTVTIKSSEMKDITAEFRRDGGLDEFRSHAEVIYDQERHRIEATFNSLQDIEGGITLSSPLINPLSTYVKIEQQQNNFRSHGEVSIGSSKSEVDVSFGTTPKLEGSFILSSPYMTNIRAGFDHYGKLPNIVSHAQLLVGTQDNYDAKLTISNTTSLSGSLTISTPFKMFETMETSFSHEGTLQSFRSHAEYAIGSNKTELDLHFNSLGQYNGQVSIKSHLMPDFSAEFDHNGVIKKFKTHGEYSIAGDKSELDLIVDLNNKIDTSLTLRLPGREDISAVFTHSGGLSEFKTYSEVKNGDKVWEGEMEFSVGDKVQGRISLKPARGYGYKNVLASLEHKLEAKELTSHVEYILGRKRSVGDIHVALSDRSSVASVTLKSPYIDNIEVNLRHSGQPKDFTTHADLTIGKDRSEGDISLQVSQNSIASSISIVSPYMDAVNININHKGVMKRFTTNADVTVGTKRSEGEVTFQYIANAVTLKATAKYPDSDDIIINFSHSGESDNFVTHGDITAFGQKSKADVQLSLKNGVTGSLIMATPNYGLKAIHSHQSGKLSSTIELRNKTETYSVETELSTRNTFEVSINVISPIVNYERASVKYTHSGKPVNFNCHSEVSVGNRISVGDLRINVEDLSNMLMKAEISVDADKYVAESTFKNDNTIEASFRVTSPIEGYEQLSAVYTHTGKPSNFQCNMVISGTQNNHVADLKLDVEDLQAMTGSFVVSSDMVPNVNARFSHTRTSTDYRSVAEIGIKDEVIYSLTTTFSNKSDIEGDIELRTPITGYHLIKLSGLYGSVPHGVKSSLSLTLGGDRNEADINFTTSPKLEGSFNMRSAYLPRVFAGFDLSGSIDDFHGSSELQIDGEKKAGVTAVFKPSSKILGTFFTETPFENYTRVAFEFSANSREEEADATLMLANADKKIIDAVVKYSKSDKMSTEVSLRSTYIHPLSASFDVSGVLTNFKANAILTHNGEQLMTSSADFSYAPAPISSAGSLSINDISAAYSFDQAAKDIKSSADLMVVDDRWHIDASYSNKKAIESQMNIDLPGREPIHAKFFHNRRQFKSSTHAELELSDSNKYEYDMQLKWRRVMQGDFTIKTPIEGIKNVKLELNHETSLRNIESSGILTYEKQVIKVAGNLKNVQSTTTGGMALSSPFSGYENIETTFYMVGPLSNLRVGGKVVYAEGEAVDTGLEYTQHGTTIKSRFHLMSKFTDEIVVSFNHTGSMLNHENSAELAMGADNRFKVDTAMKSGTNYLTYTSTSTTIVSGETFKQVMELKHDGTLDNFRTEALLQSNGEPIKFDCSFQMKPVIEGSASLVTPFENFEESKISFSQTSSAQGFQLNGEVQYALEKKVSGKIDIFNSGWKRMVSTIELKTPFKDMEINRITYQHTGDDDSFQCDVDMSMSKKFVKGTLKASKAPMSIAFNVQTPFKGYQKIGLNGNFISDSRGRYSSWIEGTWHPRNTITLEGSFSQLRTQTEGSAVISTPFDVLNHASLNFVHRPSSRNSIETLKATYNSETVVDLELDHDVADMKKVVSFTVKAPRPMKFDFDGHFDKNAATIDKAYANWNMDDSDSNIMLNAGYDFRAYKYINFRIVHPRQTMQYVGTHDKSYSKSDLSWGEGTTMHKAGYEISSKENGANLKVVLPSRTLEMTGTHKDQVTEATFKWDADGDQSRKVGFRAVLVPTKDAIKANVDLMMPSLGKNVKVGSEVVVNRGRVIFDGKAEFSYSSDKRKTIIVSSKLEDISDSVSTKNYSFIVGLSHPYSTVGIKLKSHVGNSVGAYSAGMGLEYVTVRRQTKTFHIGGEIDKLRKEISFKLQSPMKSIHISGIARTGREFHVSLMNVYDERSPLVTRLIVKPAARSIQFVTNYDLDNPRSAFHISAQYVNSSAVAAEMYRVVGNDRVTDVLLTARLNNSHLLHSRVHWRPEMITELEAFANTRLDEYAERSSESARVIRKAVANELRYKKQLIRSKIVEEIGEETMEKIESTVNKGQKMLDDASNSVYNYYQPYMLSLANSTQHQYNYYVRQYNEIYNNISLPTIDTSTIDFQAITEPVAFINDHLDMIKLPSQHIPLYVSKAMTDGVASITNDEDKYMLRQMTQSMEIPSRVSAVIKEMLENVEHELAQEILPLLKVVRQSTKSSFTVYNPAHGEIQAETYLLVPVLTLDAMPTIDTAMYIDKVMSRIPSLSDITPEIPDLSGEWLPPFTGVATVSKGRKITTFDGYVYDLNMDCTFVLAKDFTDGNFSIILNNDGETTLTVLTPGSAIEITQSGEILVGGKPADLPYIQNNVTIIRSGESIVQIQNGNNFKVTYDLSVDHITVGISGWYHGKTGGLLGTYDNEPSNEFMTSFNKVNSNVKRFAKTWEAGKTVCR